ncbi:hypothetical protein OF376_02335 [Ureaplasma miroungigenitalium]|uniref:Uncharacterized protein n=1 Tax=Ureaplasma miroungigenitalium TaxID=1042321 RepID=A0ABT3BND3_9BACT|nr:hypothetical protein [Ureaplasma miroungigenitalium]MCV3728601.1 hypothetical protein [Ureaplasma miroungigenitalium]MCV3734392.1 hypothetical protein [Ureaplasma miroungigenitalium]
MINDRKNDNVTSVFDPNDLFEERPLHEQTIEELQYQLDYEDLDPKKRKQIKDLIRAKEKQK